MTNPAMGASSRPSRAIRLVLLLEAVLGGLVLVWSLLDQERIKNDLERLQRTHVDLTVKLIADGLSHASAAMDSLAEQAEEELAIRLEWLAKTPWDDIRPETLRELGLEIYLREEPGAEALAVFSETAPARRAAVVERLRRIPADEPLDETLLSPEKLLCASAPLRQGRAVACRPAETWLRFKQDASLGHWLREVAVSPVRYVLVQDADGILAGAGDFQGRPIRLDDPILADTLRSGAASYRFLSLGDSELFEGLSLLALPDDSRAVLRVGLDAGPVQAMRQSVRRRHLTLLAAVVLLLAGTLLAGWRLSVRDRRLGALEEAAAERERERQHWQSLGQMAAGVAHEVRNPLNTARMAAQRLEREFSVPEGEREEFRDLCRVLRSECDRIGRVIEEFLDLSRPLVLNPAPARPEDFEPALFAGVRLRAEAEKKTLRIRVEEIPPGRYDLPRLRQIADNLVGNALDAIAPSGEVRVRLWHDSGTLRLLVDDNGPGMDPSLLERIRQPFTSTKARGLGMGLFLCRRMAEAHGGGLVIESEPQKGTRVEVFVRPAPPEPGE